MPAKSATRRSKLTALQHVAEVSSLKRAWNDVVSGKRGRSGFVRSWSDGDSLQRFEKDLDNNLLSIQRKISDRTYGFSPLTPVFVPKSNGSERLICVPTVGDRIVQRSILNFLRAHSGWMANEISFGFVPDRTVAEAADNARNLRSAKPWAFKTDITSFFDRIDRELLTNRVRVRVGHPSIVPLLLQAIDCEVKSSNQTLSRKLKRSNVRLGRGVRQGMPLSPYFANVMLEPFDIACTRSGISGIRYADDLIFFGRDEAEIKEISRFCIDALDRLNLEIPGLYQGSKTQIYSPDKPAEFLGVEISESGADGCVVRISNAQMDKIRERLYQYGSIRFLESRGLNVAKFGNALDSAIRSYESVYQFCDNNEKLLELLVQIRKTVISRVMAELGVSVAELDEEKRWFLGF